MRLVVAALLVLGLSTPVAAHADIEDYASYDPQTRCKPKPKPGTEYLGHWIVRRYDGRFGGISRACSKHTTSEHMEGRAFDWTLDARKRADRERARAFLDRILQTDRRGNTHAWARRMGVMYIIWNDRMFGAWDRFRREPYLSSSCETRKKCSATLRHRDHMHISLSHKGARGNTSWYDRRL